MSRVIKFRGITKDKQAKFVYGCYRRHVGKQDGVVCEYISDDNGILHPIWEGTAGQFIGLYDTDKTEIYEGDIIEATDWKTKNKHQLNVIWTESDTEAGWSLTQTGWYQSELKVIGNIHSK